MSGLPFGFLFPGKDIQHQDLRDIVYSRNIVRVAEAAAQDFPGNQP